MGAIALIAALGATGTGCAQAPPVPASDTEAQPPGQMAEGRGRGGAVGGADPVPSPGSRPRAAVRPDRPVRFTVAATGDFLLHQSLIDQAAADARAGGTGSRGAAFDFRPMLARLKPVIEGSALGICHVETPVAGPAGPFSGYPDFNSPPQIIEAIRDLGYDTCSTASNHALDGGAEGVRRTLDALDRAGIRHAGTARSAAESRQITMLTVRGVAVAHLAYTYGTNGVPAPPGRPWIVNSPLAADRIIGDAARARAAGAEAVIVSLHWGEEYRHAPPPNR